MINGWLICEFLSFCFKFYHFFFFFFKDDHKGGEDPNKTDHLMHKIIIFPPQKLYLISSIAIVIICEILNVDVFIPGRKVVLFCLRLAALSLSTSSDSHRHLTHRHTAKGKVLQSHQIHLEMKK